MKKLLIKDEKELYLFKKLIDISEKKIKKEYTEKSYDCYIYYDTEYEDYFLSLDYLSSEVYTDIVYVGLFSVGYWLFIYFIRNDYTDNLLSALDSCRSYFPDLVSDFIIEKEEIQSK